MTIVEIAAVLAVASTLAVIGASVIPRIHERLELAECRTQLTNIGSALAQYREEHRGQAPPSLGYLARDGYIAPAQLVCPTVRKRAPQAVLRLAGIRRATKAQYWASYWLFSRVGLDGLFRRRAIPASYSAILQRRKADTPVCACYDHREPRSVEGMAPASERGWYSPTSPVIVLRVGGQVNYSHYGGTMEDLARPDTIADVSHL